LTTGDDRPEAVKTERNLANQLWEGNKYEKKVGNIDISRSKKGKRRTADSKGGQAKRCP